jgi:hypothetical protein
MYCALAGTPQEVYDALNKLGFDSFRCGQEEVIMQILCGKTYKSDFPAGVVACWSCVATGQNHSS